jgi:hypothetical protein
MIDYTKLRAQLSPQPMVNGPNTTRLRVGTVTAVNSDGTVDIDLSEATVENVPVLNGVMVFVDSVVQVLVYTGSLLVLGTVAESADNDSTVGGSNSAIQPLVSASSTDALITSVSHTFLAGYAYKISWFWAGQINGGTPPFAAYSRIRRSSTSGTAIDEALATTIASTTAITRIQGSVIVKCTVADTTQTIALCGGFLSAGSPTSIDVEAASTRRTRLIVKRIGTAAKYASYPEIPTA